jgi:hypothetical protein
LIQVSEKEEVKAMDLARVMGSVTALELVFLLVRLPGTTYSWL